MCKRLFILLTFFVVLGLVVPNVVFADVFEVRIDSGEDDLEEIVADGTYDWGSSDLEITEEGNPDANQLIGLRFNNVAIPQGATITGAYVQFQVDEGDIDVPGDNRPGTKFLRGEAVDNAAPFSQTPFNISSRPTTTAEASWDWPEWLVGNEAGPDQRTSDISAVIQEIVDRAGWTAGNSLVLIITGSGENTADAFEDNPDQAALLHVEFTSEPAGPVGPFLQEDSADGIVSMEAENFHANTPQGAHTYELVGPTDGFTGVAGMQSLPDSGGNNNSPDDYLTLSPRLDYEVFFVTSGTHYVWLRAWGIDGSADSCHTGLDNQHTPLADRVSGFNNNYTWTNSAHEDPERIQMDVPSAGLHTFNIWMREDGALIDKIVLTTNPDYVPEGDGPAESGTGMPAGAYGAEPANGAVDVKAAPTLSWAAPDDAFKHDLYLGTDAALVAAGDASVSMGSLAEASYEVDPNTPLSRGTTYYWKVDVTTGTARTSEMHPGNVWSFRVADENTASWLAAAEADSPAYVDTFVENGPYDIGALGGELTYEFVVLGNPDEQEVSMALIGRHGHGDTTVALKYEQWNNLGTYGATVFGVMDYDYGVPNALGEYTHLTFVSSETSNTTALYVNGVPEGSIDSAITLSGIVGIGQAIQDPEGANFIDPFDGTIFGVAIYDGILTDEQIAAHADAYFNPAKEIIPVDPGTEGLIAYYALDGDPNDSSGNGIHGTIYNAETGGLGDGGSVWVDDPERGTVISFNGTADGAYVRAGEIPQMTLTNDFTWAFWAKQRAENTLDNDIIFGNRMDENAVDFVPRQFIKFTPTKFEWHMNGNGDDNMEYDDIPADVWLHHAVVKEADQLTYYRNGIEAGSGTITQPLDVPQPLFFGGDNEGLETENWNGLMSDACIYDRALSTAEVMYLADLRATPVDPGTDNLAAAYVFDADAADSSGNGLDGTLLGDAHVADGVLVLDGDDDAVAIPGIGDGLTEFSFVMNIYPTVDQVPLAFSGGLNTDSWGGGIHLKLQNGNINVGVNGLAGGDVVGTSIVEPNMWTHLALTVSPTEVAVYVNGEKEGSRMGEAVPAVNVGAAAIGAWNNGGTDVQREMAGMMDDVLLFDRALSVGEIRYLAGFRAMKDPGTDNLIAAYAFENDVLDGSGNGNDATVNGDPAFVEGMVGTALEFDGDGDFLDCGANSILALEDAVSISAWIKVAVAGADHKVGGNQDGANGGYKMSVYGDKIEFEIRTAANSAVLNRSVEGGTIIEVDTWYHVVGVYSLEDGYIRTYVDGELDRELLTTEALGASPGPLMIGCEPFNTGSYNFNGIMDEVSVYDKALSAAEARYIANN